MPFHTWIRPLRAAVIILVLLSGSLSAVGATLSPFTSDGCSAFPDGTANQQTLWLPCCTAHDFAYWRGGTYQQRLSADLQLRECVSRVGEPEIAALMLAGVRVGGSPWLPTRFRWGYGWPWPRSYRALTPQELAEVAAMSDTY